MAADLAVATGVLPFAPAIYGLFHLPLYATKLNLVDNVWEFFTTTI